MTLGEFFRQEREKRGITIEQVASATKISVRLLQSLEADRYSDLPAVPFVRGFVIAYCRFIGLDPDEVVHQFSDFLSDHAKDRISRDSGHSGYAFEKKATERSRAVLWVIMLVFLILGGSAMLILKPSLRQSRQSRLADLKAALSTSEKSASKSGKSEDKQQNDLAKSEESENKKPEQKVEVVKASDSENEPKKEVGKEVASAEPKEKEPEEKPKENKKEDQRKSVEPYRSVAEMDELNKGDTLSPTDIHFKVVFRALADVWVRYRVDGRPLMKFMLLKERMIVLRARDAIRFQVSNPKAVEYRVDRERRFRKFSNAKELHPGLVQDGKFAGVHPPELLSQLSQNFPLGESLPSTPDPAPEAENGLKAKENSSQRDGQSTAAQTNL